jgi:hypothetical protein
MGAVNLGAAGAVSRVKRKGVSRSRVPLMIAIGAGGSAEVSGLYLVITKYTITAIMAMAISRKRIV